MDADEGDGLVMERPYAARGTVQTEQSPTLTTGRGGGTGTIIRWPSLNGDTELKDGDGVVTTRPYSTRKSVMQDGTSFGIAATAQNSGVSIMDDNEQLRIRYLTPRECFRLMGQKDDAIDRIMEVEPSKTALYKMAGNSIVVDVLEAIFKGIYIDGTFDPPKPKQTSLGAYL